MPALVFRPVESAKMITYNKYVASKVLDLENKRQQFWFCCCQADPHLELSVSPTIQIWTSLTITIQHMTAKLSSFILILMHLISSGSEFKENLDLNILWGAFPVFTHELLSVTLPCTPFYTRTIHCYLRHGNCQQKSWKNQSKLQI